MVNYQETRVTMHLLKPETSQNKNFKIGEIWNFLLAFVFHTLSPNVQIWVSWGKMCQISDLLTTFCCTLCTVLSNLTLLFKIQMSKFWHFGSKSINLLILAKFWLYPILKVLISNLRFAFCGSYQPSTQLHKPIQCIRFSTYLENVLSVFSKSLKILLPQLLFYEGAFRII